MCYFNSLVNEYNIVSLLQFIRGPFNKNNWLFLHLATKMSLNQGVGKFSQLTWHSDWFIRLSASIVIGQWHLRCLRIKARETAASWLGIPIGLFDWLHLLTVANNITWFYFGIYTPQKELCQGSLVLLWNPKNSLQSRNPWKNGSVLF